MNVAIELQKFGISEGVTRTFTSGTDPNLVNYLDFMSEPINVGCTIAPDGAVESDYRPVLYYIDYSRLSTSLEEQSVEIATLNKSIASRGERVYLAIVKPGRLDVAPIELGKTQLDWQVFDADNCESCNFYANLVYGKLPRQDANEPDLVHEEMYKLLMTGAEAIRHKIGRDNVLSLIGRALFFRFLCDRKIVTEADTSKICQSASSLRACFDNAENSYHTSKWLDHTFNGHFLPLRDHGTLDFFNDLNRSSIVFPNLKAIVRGLEPIGPKGSTQFQYQFDWNVFDFAHVPVGLLSQVYEDFSWKWDRLDARRNSVHYTPGNIASTLVEEAFEALENPEQARVLDPACGAGVFLVLAFRRLYMEHWRASGSRPNARSHLKTFLIVSMHSRG